MRLKNKVAVITGGGKGIGGAIASAYAREGAVVTILDFDHESVIQMVTRLNQMGSEAWGTLVDISKSSQVNKAIEDVVDRYGRIDILVNSAGIYTAANILEMSDQTWQQMIDINLTGVFYCCRAVGRVMLPQKMGSIINISSISGISRASNKHAHYGAAKAGVIGFTRTLAAELGPYGIRANVIAPGVIQDTKMGEEARIHLGDTYRESIPLRRFGVTGDLTGAAVFLASDESSWITGESLNVNGGYYMP